jgi:hypothetical protein
MAFKDPEKARQYRKKYYEDNKEHKAIYRENNKQKIKALQKKWYEENKERIKAKMKEYTLKFPGKIAENRRKWADRNVEKRMFRSAKNRATRENILFDLEVSDIVVPVKCPILNMELKHDNRGNAKYNSPSLDKIDNSKGYIKGNIQVISYKANTMKGDATPKELLQFAYWVLLTYGHIIDKEIS